MTVTVNDRPTAVDSPWWNDHSAAYLLRHAIANGAHVQTAAEHFDGEDLEDAADLLSDISLEQPGVED